MKYQVGDVFFIPHVSPRYFAIDEILDPPKILDRKYKMLELTMNYSTFTDYEMSEAELDQQQHLPRNMGDVLYELHWAYKAKHLLQGETHG